MCIDKNKYLYKYYSCKGENESRIEARLLGELYFASPLKFNDPYDCQYPKITNKTRLCKKNKVEQILEEEKFNFEDTYKKLLEDNEETILKVYKRQAELLGILCLTKNYDNVLMWSHYADNDGMCLAYDMQILNNDLFKKIRPLISKRGDIAFKETYAENRIFKENVRYVSSINMSAKLFFKNPAKECKVKYWQKLKEWKYEKEYRIGVSLGGNIAVTIPNVVKEVYLGCNTTIHQALKIWSICKRNKVNVPIFVMNKKAKGLAPILLSPEKLDELSLLYKEVDDPIYLKFTNL